MASPSNLYAEKVFAEHPLALWALDDKADYVSLIPESFRDIASASWTVSGGTASTNTLISNEPFPDSFTTTISGSDDGQVTAKSPLITNSGIFNYELSTFAIGLYAYSDSEYISSFELGYEYLDGLDTIQVLKKFNTSITKSWLFLSETFDAVPNNTDFRILIKINYITIGVAPQDYLFYLNGLSVGQWAEEFHSTSLGVEPVDFPSSIALSQDTAVLAEAYGLQDLPAYYLTKDNALAARNSGIPMVYGASNVTLLSPNNGKPSLIVPGLGFLNEAGRFKTYTVEMWLRVNAGGNNSRRIFGPISSTDGLYVEGPFLTLRIGDVSGSHFVGEWSRPMLTHIVVSGTSASVLVNGEEVISFQIDQSKLQLPEELSTTNKSQDWLGFYAYEDVSPIAVDTVAIYSYQVPSIVAKRRWVYGQAVELPENINAAYSGTSTQIDYAFADYTNSYSYPDFGKWSQAAKEGFSVNNKTLSFSNYQLPTVYLNNKTYDEWLEACSPLQGYNGDVLSLRPNESWNSTDGYILFDRLSFLDERTEAVYGLFEEKTSPGTEEVLFNLENRITGNYLKITSINDSILYRFRYNGPEEVIYETTKNPGSQIILAGIDIRRFARSFGRNVAAFLGTPSQISVYVGGSKELNQTYSGYIHRVAFSTARNLRRISGWFDAVGTMQDYQDLFDEYFTGPIADAGEEYFGNDGGYWVDIWDGGAPDTFPTEPITEYFASYNLVPYRRFGKLKLDIALDAYWEDYQPLIYFAQFVKDARNDTFYDLDFIQFNVDYPVTTKIVDGIYDTSEAIVKTYVSFQYIRSGANATSSSFSQFIPLSTSNVVEPGEEWLYTKYEVVDGTIIYPPVNAAFDDIAIVTHIEGRPPAILSQPVAIRSLQLASQAFNQYSSNPIGTRFGTPIFPYKKSGVYFDYKNRNPFIIYKGSTPHLYLTKNSGIRQAGVSDPLVDRGLSIPINQALATGYNVIAMQMSMRYMEERFPSEEKQIFEIQGNNAFVKFFVISTHPQGSRGKLFAKNTITGQIENGISFYLNGKLVKEPELTIDEWSMLGLSFANNLNLDNAAGAIRINGPVLVNNITHYESTNLQEVQKISIRPWFKVKFLGASELDWQFWSSAYLWDGVLVLSSSSYYGVNPEDIYKTYTGTNKFIIDDDRTLSFGDYQYSAYKDISWESSITRPV
jgi:hypothetical protein